MLKNVSRKTHFQKNDSRKFILNRMRHLIETVFLFNNIKENGSYNSLQLTKPIK